MSERRRRDLLPVFAMVDALSPRALAEVERYLRADLKPPPSPRERRVRELGSLAALLEGVGPTYRGFPEVSQARYDDVRPKHALSGETLRRRYGSFARACWAAWSMLPDGRRRGPSNPWPSTRGRRREPHFTDEEIGLGVYRCGIELLRMPSSADYTRWSLAKRAAARERGLRVRVPTIRTVLLHFPAVTGGFGSALAASRLTEAAVGRARVERYGVVQVGEITAVDLATALPEASLLSCGIDPDAFARAGVLALPVAVASRLARELRGSLDWLVGHSVAPHPAVNREVAFDHEGFAATRRQRRVKETVFLEELRMPYSRYRQLVRGTSEPTLGEVVGFARILDVPASALTHPTTG